MTPFQIFWPLLVENMQLKTHQDFEITASSHAEIT